MVKKQNYTKGLESLMNIITQKNKNTKRYLPHELKTRIYAVEMYRNCGDIEYVCRKYHISRTSLWRWNKKYDGSKESLTDVNVNIILQKNYKIKMYNFYNLIFIICFRQFNSIF